MALLMCGLTLESSPVGGFHAEGWVRLEAPLPPDATASNLFHLRFIADVSGEKWIITSLWGTNGLTSCASWDGEYGFHTTFQARGQDPPGAATVFKEMRVGDLAELEQILWYALVGLPQRVSTNYENTVIPFLPSDDPLRSVVRPHSQMPEHVSDAPVEIEFQLARELIDAALAGDSGTRRRLRAALRGGWKPGEVAGRFKVLSFVIPPPHGLCLPAEFECLRYSREKGLPGTIAYRGVVTSVSAISSNAVFVPSLLSNVWVSDMRSGTQCVYQAASAEWLTVEQALEVGRVIPARLPPSPFLLALSRFLPGAILGAILLAPIMVLIHRSLKRRREQRREMPGQIRKHKA